MAMTAEEKSIKALARAEAKAEYWQEQANKLAVQLTEAQQALSKERAERETTVAHFKVAAKAADEAAQREREESNTLRTIVRDLELTNARQNGYIDGVEETLPPRMVEERRSLRRMEIEPIDIHVGDPLGVIGSRHPRTKPWWHK